MIKRKVLKQEGRKSIKKNYWIAIFVCLLALLFAGSYQEENINYNINNVNNVNNNYIDINNSNYDITSEVLETIFKTDNIDDVKVYPEVTNGVFRVVFNVMTQFERILFKAVKSIMNIFDSNKAGIFITLIIYVLTFTYRIFLAKPLVIGVKRFFLETRLYSKTKFNRMFYCFNKNHYLKTVATCLRKNIYLFLWNLTIVGGIIKHYSYWLVDYLIAENPNLSSKEAILLSRKMMQGYKWEAFKLDMSFLGWNLLKLCTFGLTGMLYSNAYQEATNVEFYTINKNNYQGNIVKDNFLETNTQQLDAYPGTKARQQLDASNKFNYYKRYSLSSMILFFFCFAITGFIWETSLHFVLFGQLVKKGTMLGPWLPIYGFGCVSVLLLLYPKKLKKITDNPILTFLLVMLLCTTIEYFTSVYLEAVKGARWWDYSGHFLNINGRVCLENALFFAAGGTACIYIFTPFLDRLFAKIPKKIRIILCVILISLYIGDLIYSHFNPNMGSGITFNIIHNLIAQT